MVYYLNSSGNQKSSYLSYPCGFKEATGTDKGTRNRNIRIAHLKYRYTLKEIADYLRIHYTTVSKALKDEGDRK